MRRFVTTQEKYGKRQDILTSWRVRLSKADSFMLSACGLFWEIFVIFSMILAEQSW
jgi:hypothetical protein